MDKEKQKQIEEMTKDFLLCYPCEMFSGYIDENGDMQGDKICLAGLDCTKCGITRDLANHLIGQGYRKILHSSAKGDVNGKLKVKSRV